MLLLKLYGWEMDSFFYFCDKFEINGVRFFLFYEKMKNRCGMVL